MKQLVAETSHGAIPRILIAGGGAGGLELVVALARQVRNGRLKADITLIDPAPTHFWKPRLHEVAAGLVDVDTQRHTFAALGGHYGFQFVQDAVAGLSPRQAAILQSGATVAFDYLVLAIGSTVNDFHTPGVAAHCAMLDSLAQAEQVHECFIKKAWRSLQVGAPPLRVSIVGAGATGVELAAELHYAVQRTPAYPALRNADRLSITVLDMADRVLPALEADISRYAARKLADAGTKLMLGQRVVEVTETTVRLADGQVIPSDLTVWASGIKGPEALTKFPSLTLARDGRVVISSALLCVGTTNILALGDCASLTQSGKILPPTAQLAHQQAKFLAKSLPRRLRERPPGQFTYHYRGTIVAFGGSSAIGELGGVSSIRLRGMLAYLAYVSLYLTHLTEVYGWLIGISMLLGRDIRQAAGNLPVKLHGISAIN